MTNKIIFTSIFPQYEIPHPVPASKTVPEWWRKESVVKEKMHTMKKCVPILDSLTAGYVITLPSDVYKARGVENFGQRTDIGFVSQHYPLQTKAFPASEEFDPQPYKWINPWKIKTPKGYSCLFVHPLNSGDSPFHSFSGIVDTDKHPVTINFPFLVKKEFEGLIPAGTPIIQVIPFKRDSWESKVIDNEEFVEDMGFYKIFNPPFGAYKKNWWSKKEFR
ncbi:hypothetical protein UFOVP359_120 [uncultured Caudovirales phage]|uniref:Uncharacterized protein n=1 Tax=uncultured Caudovirales phage TaxID=2100421 RepID=A0A6J7WVY4_9CAUD|nr:hypothetical protein UFOVP359_120 [uncultured Caudovirales phage]